MPRTLVTFSIYQKGVLVDQRYVTDADEDDAVDRIAATQATLCSVIEAAGGSYVVEVEFWDGEHVRWGTDPDGMVWPFEVALEELDAHVQRMMTERGSI